MKIAVLAGDGIGPEIVAQATRVLEVLAPHPAIDAATLPPLALGPEPVLPPQSVLLGSGQTPGSTVRVATDGVRPFAVVPSELGVPGTTGRAP